MSTKGFYPGTTTVIFGGEIYVKFYVQGLSKHKALHMIHIVEAVHV